MIPVGAPTNSFSARRASFTLVQDGNVNPPRSHRAAITAHSSAADDERPDPTGTSLATLIRAGGTWCPSAPNVTASPKPSDTTVQNGLSVRDTATAVTWGRANGSTYPSL